ncbi:MAG: bifunctional 4-hydroxy-2-oxoglutarate aldolase/2-dehydro-3-deoxy-phosphogluconate aldolase, partial [Clostridiales bacterium]|nr:bifunctional 4-hydroxy-2-oxoglutarate aldolase/2-dehydro-3-deoxy-phosphogluconate aldolase [Clostridiales bacterium]
MVAQQIYEMGIVPVVKLDHAEDAVPLARALFAGGMRIIEVTFRTDAATESIKRIAHEVPEMLVGAGTVLTEGQVDSAIKAGAKFIVTPGFNERTVQYCLDLDVPVFPGCNTPSAIEAALALGLTNLKFFPAEASGGLPMIKALSGPYPNIRFMPTGGINEVNLNEYLAFDKIIACGGSWMVKENLIREGNFHQVTKNAKKAINLMLGFELKHIGINTETENEALYEADRLGKMFGWNIKNEGGSVFSGTGFELLKKKYLGDHGHIAIGTNSVDRAYSYLHFNGYKFQENTAKKDQNG